MICSFRAQKYRESEALPREPLPEPPLGGSVLNPTCLHQRSTATGSVSAALFAASVDSGERHVASVSDFTGTI